MKGLVLRLVTNTAVVVIFALTATTCHGTDSDIDRAKETVLSWFAYYSDNPFSPHGGKPGLKHNDYWGVPGVEGIRISIIDRRIEILEATYFIGDYTLYKTREEKLIRVVAKLKQHFYVNEEGARKVEKEIEISFYLSKFGTAAGEYLIINHSPVDYDIFFDDAIRKYLNSPSGRTSRPILRQSLVDTGMKGLR